LAVILKPIPVEKGIFLASTWRMHPDICFFDSEMFYESRLHTIGGLENQRIEGNTQFIGSGLYYKAVEHEGNTNLSIEEINEIEKIVQELTKGDVFWYDEKNIKKVLMANDIKIITPYNSNVFEMQKQIPNVAIGTVDKFQGQEAPVVIYSLASSSPEDAPRGMEFLYSPNRLNVAVSRARAMFIMVGNPRLFEPDCKSPEQIKLANPFCRFIELANSLP
jgi:superfamily I DNA and/or RNA helicase